VHSDDIIIKYLCLNIGHLFLDIIGPSNIASVVAMVKNRRDMWEQNVNVINLGAGANGNQDKKSQPLFTVGSGKKRRQCKNLQNIEGMQYFRWAESKWREIHDNEQGMTILYNG
jgi:hypothetical protein